MPEAKLYTRCSACEFVRSDLIRWEYVGLLDLFVVVDNDSPLVKLVSEHHRQKPIEDHGRHFLFINELLARQTPREVINFTSRPEIVFRNYVGTLFANKRGTISQLTINLRARKLF